MKLTIISHTEHYKQQDGTVVGWGPTINEINHLVEEFDEITHVAMLHKGSPPSSSLSYNSSKINFVPLPVLGGKSIYSKLKLLFYVPRIIQIVWKELKKSDVFQLRTPTGIGVFLIPYLTFFVKKKGWYKYAGNWNQKNPPLGYRLQRWMLKKQKRKVTINGSWKYQPKQCITFENPCLTEEDRAIGRDIIKYKKLPNKYDYCFVGGLNHNKGIDRILETFKYIDTEKINVLHIVGEGVLKKEITQKAQQLSIGIIIYGSLPKNEVQEIYKKSHFIILPSKNEGFPKVIGEAMNFGCVPIVSDVSCIGQYIKNNYNGFLVNSITTEAVKNAIFDSLVLTQNEFSVFIEKNYKLANKFTYTHYNKRIQKELLKNN